MKQMPQPEPRKKTQPLTVLLSVMFIFFVGLLITVYVVTKRAHPIILDQNGHPVEEQSAPSNQKVH